MRKSLLVWSAFAAVAMLLPVAGANVGMANDLPGYYGAVSVQAQPLPWTPEAHADFGVLLAKLGEKGALDPASVRVVTAAGQALPTKFEADAGATDSGRVRWSAPAMPNEAGNVEFRIHFAPQSETKWTPVQPDEVGAVNLLPNGGLETLNQSQFPSSWTKWRNVEAVNDPKVAHSGQSCVKLNPYLPDGAPANRYQTDLGTPGDPGTVVKGGETYALRYWARMENGEGGSVACGSTMYVYWCDAKKEYVKHEGGPLGGRGNVPWREFSTVLQAPANARYVRMYATFYCAKGAMYVDDISITSTQTPQLDSARSLDGGKTAALGVAAAGVRRFNFGKDESTPWPGFAPVTPQTAYSKQLGFGWNGTPGMQAEVRALPDNLARSFVIPAAAPFVVDLPDGNYSAWFLIGDNGLGGQIIPTNVNWRVQIGGREVLSYHPDAKSWYEQVAFRNFNDWWEPGMDVYDRFIAPQYKEYRASFTAQGGSARFELDGMPLCAMVVYPADLEAAISEELGQLRATRKRAVAIKLDAPPRETPVGLGDADRQRGYALFERDLTKAVLPVSAPQEGEIVARLESFSSLGEYVPFSFAVYPMRDLGAVSVTVSDLVGPDGGRIASNTIELGVVRYVPAMPEEKEYRYQILPGPIQARNPMPVPKDVAMRWWLRVRVPAEAKAGIYSGAIHVAPANAPASDLPVALRVVPIKLGPTPVNAGMYHFNDVYWYIYAWRRCFDRKDPWLKEQTFRHEWDDMAILKEYGWNSLMFCDDNRQGMRFDANGQGVFDEDSDFVQWMDLYAKAGMQAMGWYGMTGIDTSYLDIGVLGPKLKQFSPEWERAYRSILSWVKETEKKRGWPEVLIYVSDELSNEGAAGGEMGRRLVQLTKDIPGIRTLASLNGPWERVMLPGLKIAMPNHAFPITEETLAEIRKAGCDLWVYNCGRSRVTWGLYLWRVGAKGRSQWAYRTHTINEPWNAFDGDSPSLYNVTWMTPDKPLPTPILWEVCEGLNDLRYVKALEKAIADARASQNSAAVKAADAAQKELDGLRELVPVDVRLLTGEMDAKEAGKDAVGNLASSRFLDRYRWTLAGHILAIQSALGK